MNAASEEGITATPSDLCTVVVVYNDAFTRSRALAACDYLVSQIWESVELDFHWWRSDFLKDPVMAEAAAQKAIEADFIIVSSGATNEIPAALRAWFEAWIGKRTKREGALLDLAATQTIDSHHQTMLQEIARRGRLDYLSQPPGHQEPSLRQSTTTHPVARPSTEPPNPHSHFGLND